MDMDQRFSEYTRKRLEEAGWFVGRNMQGEIRLPKDVEIFPVALEIIAEFGDLVIGRKESGQPGFNVSKSPVWIDPFEAYWEEELEYAEKTVNERLYPIGLVDFDDSATGYLYTNTSGAIFRFDSYDWFYDLSFDRALEKMLEGIRPVPIEEASW